MSSAYELHLRCQALGRSTAATRRSEARRIAVAAEASQQPTIRLRDSCGSCAASSASGADLASGADR